MRSHRCLALVATGSARFARGAALAAAALLGAPAALAQQNPPVDFTLPEPTQTPTARPEGPADERAGVPIPPRVIPQERSAPASLNPARTAPAGLPPSLPSSLPSAALPASGATRGTGVGDPLQRPAPPLPLDQAPLPSGEEFLVDEGEWLDVRPDAGLVEDGYAPPGAQAAEPYAPASEREVRVPAGWLWALVVVLLGVLAGMAWMALRDRRSGAPSARDFGAFVTGVRQLLRERPLQPVLAVPAPVSQMHEPTGLAANEAPGAIAQPPAPVAQPLAPNLAVEVDIVRATRSLMMFTLEYQLTLWNRSDRAVRDLVVEARLVCAKREGAGAGAGARTAGSAPLATIERIGPHQRRTINATTQLALRDVEAMHQGAKPLFVPLLHLAIESAGGASLARSFVIGSPSKASAAPGGIAQASTARLHPIPLDTPPGGIAGLCANAIRHQPLSEPA